MAGRRTSLQPNLVLSAMADYLEQGHFQAGTYPLDFVLNTGLSFEYRRFQLPML